MAIYNGQQNWDDEAISIAIDSLSNIYVTGTSYETDSYQHFCTIKYNSSGIQQWVARYYGSIRSDEARSISIDKLGNIYVAGSTIGTTNYWDFCTIKYNNSGVQQWVATYDGPDHGVDKIGSMNIDGSGNIYVAGYSWRVGNFYDCCIIKYNGSGVQQWVQRYTSTYGFGCTPFSIKVDNAGNLYVTGYSIGIGNNSADYCTLKYDSSGIQQWVSSYDDPDHRSDVAISLALDDTGNVYVTGTSTGAGNVGYDYCTIKYNNAGVQQWLVRYITNVQNATNIARFIKLDHSGNVYVSGISRGANGYNNFDYCTVKYNSSGIQQWVARYNGPANGDDEVESLVLDDSGNVYITGGSLENSNYFDYCTIKYNTSGVQQWVIRFNRFGYGNNYANSMVLDGSGNIYVTGYSYGNGTNNDYCTIKYSAITGVPQTQNNIPYKFSLSQNYPNPFNPATKIKYGLPISGNVKLVVYDILGKEIKTLVNEKQNAGTYQVEFDGSNFPSGVYFYKLTTDNYNAVKKMVLIK